MRTFVALGMIAAMGVMMALPFIAPAQTAPLAIVGVSVNGDIQAAGTSTIRMTAQATSVPQYNVLDGVLNISGNDRLSKLLITTRKIVSVTSNPQTGAGTLTAEYVLKNVTYRVIVERRLNAERKSEFRYTISKGGKLFEQNPCPDGRSQGCWVPLMSGSSSVR